ncbi:MAG: hypothetical protein IKU99_07030 [Clostridia bacterium]|nr:hypothetical protein [Clostridia bacterium]
MSEKESMDIGKIVGLIMDNPQIIEQISALAKQSETPKVTEEVVAQPAESPKPQQTVSMPQTVGRGERAKLLGALKPYVSSERAKAIDSMMSIADILEMMRSR